MKLRTGDPWKPASEYGRSLSGISLNLIVEDIERTLLFHREVLGATVVYSDPDFAVLSANGAEWMLHADHTYEKHPMAEIVRDVHTRGSGIEIRLHGCDPDGAESAARTHGFAVLSPATDKDHGLREAYIKDPDGYVWVPDIPVAEVVTSD
jgi:catechol 2,3-dioxygenase-like lactoylglutathione lyase family enzyme